MRKHILALAASAALSTLAFAPGASAVTVGVTMDKFDDNFLTSVRNAIEAEATANGITVQAEDANDDTGKQISQIQNFIAQ